MDWRCTNCGSSHPRNNPPCSECGGVDFERGVVRLEWKCTDCSEPVESPHEPCPHCGGTEFERLHDAEAGPEPLKDDVRLKSSSESQQLVDDFVWECPNCEKRHMRNSPPCTRCGNAQLEKVPFETVTDDSDSGSGSGVGSGLGRWVSLGLFEHTSATLSVAGLALATLGGLIIMGGGIFAASLSQTSQRMPSSAWMIVLVGVAIGAVGAGFVLFDTRRRDISL